MRATDPAHEAKRDAFDEAVDTLARHPKGTHAPAVLNLTEAAKLVGVSRGRLYRAIEAGRLDVMPGGGPGKPTMVTREALETFALAEGLQMPDTETMAERSERTERLERSIMQTPAETERLMERLADHVVDRLTERLTEDLRAMLAPVVEELRGELARVRTAEASGTFARRSERSENVPPHTPQAPDARDTPRLAILTRLRTWKHEGLSTREMVKRLEAEGIPTLSGRGAWTSGTVSRLLQEGEIRRLRLPLEETADMPKLLKCERNIRNVPPEREGR